MTKKRFTKNQKALYNLMQEYANKGVDVSYIDIPKTITQNFLKETKEDLEQRFTAHQHDIVDTIKEMLYDLPNSRYVYNRSYNKFNEISLESFYYKAISMLQDNMQEFGEAYYNHLRDNESKIIESLEVIAGDSEDSRIRSNIVQALNILSYNNMSKEMEIVTNNWLETLANYDEE
jgi:hypothetical protein|nr:MAG TPA: hypothetical protein [Caudoviricetes sp.]